MRAERRSIKKGLSKVTRPRRGAHDTPALNTDVANGVWRVRIQVDVAEQYVERVNGYERHIDDRDARV